MIKDIIDKSPLPPPPPPPKPDLPVENINLSELSNSSNSIVQRPTSDKPKLYRPTPISRMKRFSKPYYRPPFGNKKWVKN
jgi:hypothetical protein